MEVIIIDGVWNGFRFRLQSICSSTHNLYFGKWNQHILSKMIIFMYWMGWSHWVVLTSGKTLGFKDQCRFCISFGCTLYLGAHSKSIFSCKHFINSTTGCMILTPWTLPVQILPLFSASFNCHPITCTTSHVTSYFEFHTCLIWFSTNTLSPTGNSGTRNVGNWLPHPSLDSLMLWIASAYISLRVFRARAFHYMSQTFGFNNCTSSIYASHPNMRMNALSLECSFRTKLYAT